MRGLLPLACVLVAACNPSSASHAAPANSASDAPGAASPLATAPAGSSTAPTASGTMAAAPAGTVATSASASASGVAAASPPGEGCGGKVCLSIEKCEAGACVPACPGDEVYIPRTPPEGFTLGRGKIPYGFGKRGGTPADGIADVPHNVVLTRPFCMDATEVTVRAIVRCVKEQGCREPSVRDRWATYPTKLDYPVNMVEWPVAKEYCEKQEQSLPSEAQWEWAAAGGDGRNWPWGNETPTCQHADFTEGDLPSPGGDAGCHGGGPSAVATHLLGDRLWPGGKIHDLAGNVWEWTLDAYARYKPEAQVDPVHMGGAEQAHIVRGGGWNRSNRGIMTWFRGAAIYTYKVPGLGFRCVRNPK